MTVRTSVLLLAFALTASAGQAFAQDSEQCAAGHGDVVMRAMCDELDRAMRSLRLEELETPYFLSYRVEELHEVRADGHFGALTNSDTSRTRDLSIELRVGGPDLDNSNYLPDSFGRSPLTSRYGLPLDDDYRELRRQMWLATDVAYKHALETLSKKRAALQNKTREDVPDFLDQERHVAEGGTDAPEVPDVAALESTVRDLGAVFKQLPAVDASRVGAWAGYLRSRYVNSEGSFYTSVQPRAGVRAMARTQAADGTVLQDAEVFAAAEWQDLPSLDAATSRVLELGASLEARRQAQPLDVYNGPVLFEGQAAAELFGQVFVAKLLATRVPVTDPRWQGYGESVRNPFMDKIGARVLPRFLSVRDDPTVSENNGGSLHDGYAVDAEGVPATPTTLIENGRLRTLLATRNPVAGISRSTGNRRGASVSPSNLIVAATGGLSDAELRDEFMALVREFGLDYGVVVRRLANVHKIDGRDRVRGEAADYLTRAFKVYLDGREEPIRKGELSSFSETAFKDIVAVSESVSNHAVTLVLPSTLAVRQAGALYGWSLEVPGATISIPDLLFEDATIRRPSRDTPRPPVLAHPFFE